ncbi:MAG: mechanosensitive ion channel [Gemmatimonadota bacterium]|nr:mechanosensitive ion channel [Gemmatimonadota bacterium]MDH3422893.1 mechanosensitive ion channel [Gemmatimonadota bacterium]
MLAQIQTQLVAMFQGVIDSLIAGAPGVVLAVVLVVAALVVAKVVERVLAAAMARVRFDAMVSKVGIDQTIQRMGIRESLNKVVPRIVYYLLLILFAKTAADSMGLVAISDAIGAFMAYLPNIVAALLIIVLGSAAAQFAGRAVAEAATNSGIEFGASLGGLVSGLILFVLGIMAIGQLQIDTDIIRVVTAAILAGMALAFGLAFGLGSRDVTRNILAGFYARKTFEIGKEMEIRGERGELKSITPTQTLLQQGDRVIAVANSVYLDDVVKQ